MSRKIIKNNFLANLAKKVEETKTEEQQIVEVLSNFDYEGNEFTDAEKRFVQERERVLVNECKKNRDSLYSICMTLQEISDFFKNNKERKFMAWYESAGFNKDMISRYLKRADLYIRFEDKKDMISAMPNTAIKLITNNLVTLEQQKEIMQIGCTTVEDIKKTLVSNKDNKLVPATTFKYFNPKNLNKIQKNIKKMSLSELSQVKKELDYFRKISREIENELSIKEEEFINKDNLKLVE